MLPAMMPPWGRCTARRTHAAPSTPAPSSCKGPCLQEHRPSWPAHHLQPPPARRLPPCRAQHRRRLQRCRLAPSNRRPLSTTARSRPCRRYLFRLRKFSCEPARSRPWARERRRLMDNLPMGALWCSRGRCCCSPWFARAPSSRWEQSTPALQVHSNLATTLNVVPGSCRFRQLQIQARRLG